MDNNLNQNNLNNRVFNPNDDTTWRWNDPALANTIVSEAEARQIRQIAPQFGGVFTLLHTDGSRILPSLIDHSLNNNQQLIARRAAIIITAQQTHGIPVRNIRQAVDAHRQIDSFFGEFDNNIVLHPRQADLIHKTIDSCFAAREFRRGRNLLDSNIPEGNYPNRAEVITEAALIRFFKHMVEDIPYDIVPNRYDYIRVDLRTFLRNHNNTYVFIRHAFEYLVGMYKGIGSNNRGALMLLNRLINNEGVTGAIKNAIIANIPAVKLGASLKHLQGITDEEAVCYINFLSGLVNGIGLITTNQLLDLGKGVRAILAISKTNIRVENLSYAITIASNEGVPNRLNDINTIIDYIQLINNLINTPSSQEVDARCLNTLLSFQEGALALRASAIYYSPLFKDENGRMLAKALHTAITDGKRPADSKESQVAYINLITEVINQYLYNATSYTRIVKVGWAILLGVEQGYADIENFLKRVLNRQDMCIVLNTARVLRLNASSISSIIARSQDIENNLILLNFVLDIVDANTQRGSAAMMNDFIAKQNEAMDTLNKACNIKINAISIARLMSCSNTHNDRIANLKVAIDLIEPQNQLKADEVNRYLALDGSPERINADRTQKIGRERIIATINQALEAQDAAIQGQVTMIQMLPAHLRAQFIAQLPEEMRNALIARLPENIRNPIIAALNPQNAAQ